MTPSQWSVRPLYALTREGRTVLLLDRAEPGMTGASFGNAGHIAAELVEPLPSWGLEHTSIFYAVGHQHIGLTLAPVTGELISDLVASRQPRHVISAFDLRRF
jgi:glycine/D-amino acid oxidase-like deaminating enzyme